jgi:hypothetical protein
MVMFAITPTRCPDLLAATLDELVDSSEKEFLLNELARVQPPERLHDLSKYGQRQLELGGGFYGMLPDQLTNPDSIPVPTDDAARLEAALRLAQQRSINLAALKKINPDYPLSFQGNSLADFFSGIESEGAKSSESKSRLSLELDTSALTGFFAAIEDGEIDAQEAAALAALPSNQYMLQHRRDLGYVPEPLPDTESLAEMIRIAGSADPLDRLWCWINPQNAFGYSDLVLNIDDYSTFLTEFENQKDELAEQVVKQIANYTPGDLRSEVRFAFTVGWAIRGWATPEMVGLNIEQTKDDWRRLFGTLIEETYHRLQLELCATVSGEPARDFSDLTSVDTGDARYDRLYEIVTYTVLEGAANLARGRYAAPDLPEKATAGTALMANFVEQVVEQGDVDSADALITQGLKNNGPLYGLGWTLASLIAEKDGTQAVGQYQRLGPVRFFLHGATLAVENGEPLLTPEVVAAVEALEERLPR